ncbi:hypothetical protein MNBD_GAMMA23-2309 [hydrothermal vent metagenome]|uniref:Uncharacterized protein n=1 Tax=hydrothermal vent metagenome TaxID=652676 RepID=A0A3B1A352_9ZZZZ
MKIDTSFDSAFLQLQNGVNKAAKAASEVLKAVGSEKVKEADAGSSGTASSREGSGGINVSA